MSFSVIKREMNRTTRTEAMPRGLVRMGSRASNKGPRSPPEDIMLRLLKSRPLQLTMKQRGASRI
jgi:hypothetical protein